MKPLLSKIDIQFNKIISGTFGCCVYKWTTPRILEYKDNQTKMSLLLTKEKKTST